MSTLTLAVDDFSIPQGTPIVIYGPWLVPSGAPLHRASVSRMNAEATLSSLLVDLADLLDTILEQPVDLEITEAVQTAEGVVLVYTGMSEEYLRYTEDELITTGNHMSQIKAAIREYIISVLANTVAGDVATGGLTNADKAYLDELIATETQGTP